MQQQFSTEQIAVITNKVDGIVKAIEKGKNLDAIIVRLTNLMPTLDAAIEENVLYGEEPEPLENLKQLFLLLIVRASALLQQQSVAN